MTQRQFAYRALTSFARKYVTFQMLLWSFGIGMLAGEALIFVTIKFFHAIIYVVLIQSPKLLGLVERMM